MSQKVLEKHYISTIEIKKQNFDIEKSAGEIDIFENGKTYILRIRLENSKREHIVNYLLLDLKKIKCFRFFYTGIPAFITGVCCFSNAYNLMRTKINNLFKKILKMIWL